MVKQWDSLPAPKQERKIRRAWNDIIYFMRDPYFLNIRRPNTGQRMFLPQVFNNNKIRFGTWMSGMRSGKTAGGGIGSCFTAFRVLQYDDLSQRFDLMEDSPIFIGNVATNEDQGARTIFKQTIKRWYNSPYLMAQSFRDSTYKIEVPGHNLLIAVCSSNTSGNVGETAALISIDEVDEFDDTQGDRGIDKVYGKLSKATITLYKLTGGMLGKVVSISSSGGEGSKMWRIIFNALHPTKYNNYDHQDLINLGQPIVVERAGGGHIILTTPTWVANPEVYTRADFQPDFDEDPVAAARDFGCDPSKSHVLFYRNRDILRPTPGLPNALAMYVDGVSPPIYNTNYVLTGDPARGKDSKADAFGLALAHDTGDKQTFTLREKGKDVEATYKHIIIDGMYKFNPKELGEIDPLEIEAFVLGDELAGVRKFGRSFGYPGLVHMFPISDVVFDTWNYPSLQTKLDALGIIVHNHIVRYPDVTLFKNHLYRGMVDLCDYPPFFDEARKLTDDGKKVDHPKYGYKDVHDAAVLTVVALEQLVAPRINRYYMIRRV